MALLDPGDEAIIPAPYWVSYPDMVLLADGLPVTPYAGPEQGYKITPKQLAAAITPKTRLLLLNSPSNPTGAAYTAAELARARRGAAASIRACVIGTDDMYEKIYWGSEPFTSLLTVVPELYDRTVTINGVLEGLRDDRLAHRLLRRTEGDRDGDGRRSRASRPPTPSSITQKAAIAALNGDQECVAHDEPRVQGAPRLHRRRAQQPAGRFLPAGAAARSTPSPTSARR